MPIATTYNSQASNILNQQIHHITMPEHSGSENTDNNSLSESITTINNSADNLITHTASRPKDKTALSKVLSQIKPWIPNHLILQAGPQIHNKTTEYDFKFTPTFVVALDHAELYPLHVEIGTSIGTGSDNFKAYALAVNQQGFNFDWKNKEISYQRQMLGRVEVDIPYGSRVQGTLGFEVGISDKSKGLKNSIKHMMHDIQTSTPQGLSLLATDICKSKNVIDTLAWTIIGAFAIPEVSSRIKNPDNERESVLWLGLSLGYCDYNGSFIDGLELLPEQLGSGVNIQRNAYLRHGEMITYDFNNKSFSLPRAFVKTISILNGGDKPNFISNILKQQAKVHNHVCHGNIPAVAGGLAHELLDEMAVAVNQQGIQNDRHEQESTHM